MIFVSTFTSLIVTMILMLISLMISKKSNMMREKMIPFECGFNFFNFARMPFSIQFFLIAIIFIIFDVEIILIVPLIPSIFKASIFKWLKTSMSFLIIITLGILIEWKEKTFEWKKYFCSKNNYNDIKNHKWENSPKVIYYNIFLNSSTITISVMEEFHDYTNLFLSIIITFILIVIIRIKMSNFYNYYFKENNNLEIIWTILPMFILCLIAYPSIYYLYLFDLSLNPTISIKIFGAQWYWIYENFDSQTGNSYSSYMIPDSELIKVKPCNLGWRLLMTDTRLIVPFGTEIQCLTTSLDVIHSFSIPEMGIKMDAIPGRLNSVNLKISKPGIFYGQCAEICGTGHSFMPICLEAIY